MAVIREGEVTSFDELVMPYRELLTPLAIMTAATPPGVVWHCETCHAHQPSTTLLTRPTHCNSPMTVEQWLSLFDFFRSEI